MEFIKNNKSKVSNWLMYLWLLIFTILYITVNEPTKETELTSIQTIFVLISFILIIVGVIVNGFKPKWATGIVLFVLGFNFVLTGAPGLVSIGLALDGTFAYFLLPLCFLIVISFVDEPKLDMIRIIGICVFALFLIYISVSSYALILDAKKAFEKNKESFIEYSSLESYKKEIKIYKNQLGFYFFNFFTLLNLVISIILCKKETTDNKKHLTK